MPDSLENVCEQLTVLLLKASTELTAIVPSIVRESEDSDAESDRIVCKASPREVEKRGKSPESVHVWRVPVDITLHFVSDNATQMDIALAALATAMNTAPVGGSDAEILILDNNIRSMDDTDEGDFTTTDNARTRSKRFNFLAEPIEEDLTGGFLLEDGGHLLLETV